MFVCVNCGKVCGSLLKYSCHLKIHKSDKDAIFKCLFTNCEKVLHNFNNYQSHFYRNHRNKSKGITKIGRNYVCDKQGCSFKFDILEDLLRHVMNHLRNSDGIEIKCPVAGCLRTFIKEKTFRNHINLFHKIRFLRKEIACCPSRDNKCATPEPQIILTSHTENCLPVKKVLVKETAIDIKSVTTDLLLKLKSEYNVPERVISIICDRLGYCSDLLTTQVREIIDKHFERCNTQNDVKNELLVSILPKLNLIANSSLSTYKRNQNIASHSMVKPLKINLGLNNYHKPCFFYYIPILETLKLLFEDNEILLQFNSNQESNYSKLEDYKDALFYENNEFFYKKNRIELLFYVDGFEVCNPLGSAKSKHKLLGVYFVLNNLSVHNRSQINNIMLCLLCTESHVKTFGFNSIFENVISDLKLLEEIGIVINENVTKTLKGSVVAICGDNLGLHQIGGYIENFSSAEYFCRYCHITLTEFKNNFRTRRDLRTKSSYNEDVLNLEYVDVSRGVKKDSCFNALNFFHVSTGLPPCIAHDLYEGVIPLDLCLAIHHFVNHNWFTYDYFNITSARLAKKLKLNVNFPEIKYNSKKISGHAMQNFYQLTLLPLVMIGKIKDANDSVLEMILLLLEITQIVSSHMITITQIIYIEGLIDRYLELRISLFPSNRLIRKHHYIQHYSLLLKLYGPLIKFSTMRFESKHQYFKQIAAKSRNFINLTKSLTERHQILQSTLFGQRFLRNIIISKLLHTECASVANSFPYQATTMTFKNIKYSLGQSLTISNNTNGTVSCLTIKSILVNQNSSEVAFQGNVISIVYNYKLGLYEVTNIYTNDIIVSPSDLSYPFPFITYTIGPVTYATLQWAIPCYW